MRGVGRRETAVSPAPPPKIRRRGITSVRLGRCRSRPPGRMGKGGLARSAQSFCPAPPESRRSRREWTGGLAPSGVFCVASQASWLSASACISRDDDGVCGIWRNLLEGIGEDLNCSREGTGSNDFLALSLGIVFPPRPESAMPAHTSQGRSETTPPWTRPNLNDSPTG